MVRLIIMQHNIVLIRRHPGTQRIDRKVFAKGVFARLGATTGTATNGTVASCAGMATGRIA